MKKLFLFTLLFVTFFNVKSQDLINLPTTGFVNDYEKIFSPDQKHELEKILSDYAKTTTTEICVATSADYPADVISATDLFNKWGIGKKQFNNGVLILIKKNRENNHGKSAVVPGYGLEEFLPDATLEPFKNNMINYFKVGDYYGGVKGLVLDIQKKLGNQGVEYLRQEKERKALEQEKAVKNSLYTLLYVFLLLIILGGVVYIIFIQYQKNKIFLELKKEIQTVIDNIDSLKTKLGNKIDPDVQNYVGSNTIKELTNSLVTEETRTNLQLVYNKLVDNKQIIDNIDNTIVSISKIKSDIEKYLQTDYKYCDKYLKEQLNNTLSIIKIDEIDYKLYTRSMSNKLSGLQSSLDGNMRVFLKLLLTINSIVSDKNNFDNEYKELISLHSEYIRKRNILASVKIGSRYNNLATLDFTDILNKLDSYIRQSFDNLEKDNASTAMSIYGNYVTTLTTVKSTFSSVDILFDDYNASDKYIKDNNNKIDALWSSIEYKINKSGVSYSRKTTLESIKTNINTYKNGVAFDIIASASSLKQILNDLESLLSSINSDIYSHEESERRAVEAAAAAVALAASRRNDDSYSYSSPSSSSSSFDGFGGGGSGGGGVSGEW